MPAIRFPCPQNDVIYSHVAVTDRGPEACARQDGVLVHAGARHASARLHPVQAGKCRHIARHIRHAGGPCKRSHVRLSSMPSFIDIVLHLRAVAR